MNVITLDTRRRVRRFIDQLARRCAHRLARYQTSYFLNPSRKTDPLEQHHGIWIDRHPRADLAQLAGLFKDRYAQSAGPQRERGRQAPDSATDDGDLKLLRHHLLLSDVLPRATTPSQLHHASPQTD